MIKVLLDNHSGFREEARYVCETFFEIIGTRAAFIDALGGINEDDILIYYGSHGEDIRSCKIVIPESDWSSWKSGAPEICFIEDKPVLYAAKMGAGNSFFSATDSGKGFVFGFDIIAVSFYLLSLYEETLNKERDIWGCFREEFSLKHRHRITRIPVVNTYIEALSGLIKKLVKDSGREIEFLARWKGGRRFAVALTHDVDNIRKYSFINGMKLLLKGGHNKRGDFKAGLESVAMALANSPDKDPYWSFEDFIKLEGNFGYRSTFYVVARPLNRRYDPSYRLDGRLRMKLRDLSRQGWEVGLHGPYDSFRDEKILRRQKEALEEALGKPVSGVRQHYLRFSVEDTFKAQVSAGFLYDSTLGYNDNNGFRPGLSAPFFPFHLKERRKLNVLELPLSLIDGALFEFQRYSPQEAFAQAVDLIDGVEKLEGLLVILWHTKAKDRKGCPGWWDVYSRILDYLSKKDAWVTGASEICNWWLNRIKECAG